MQLQQQIEQLFIIQQNDWPQLKNAIEQLSRIQTKQFAWGSDIHVEVQFNPGRIISTASQGNNSADKLPCFLCAENRPFEQKGIPFLNKYIILINPFPILFNHITIPLYSHVPQRIRKKITHMLTLTELLPDYIVFYNGPKCGASAPDHFHLQAGLKTSVLMSGENELRSCLIIESDSKEEMEERFEDVYQYLHHKHPDEDEPMMNLIAFTENGKYVLHIFPRKAHRPKQFYEQGKKKMLISPGALDMAGLIITPRQEDFEKLKKEDIEDIFSQVSMPVI